MIGSTPPTALHFLRTDRLLVSPQRAVQVPEASHSRFLYALEAPVYAAAEGPAGPWSSRLEARELTLVAPGERLGISSETGAAAEVVLIAFTALGELLPRSSADSRTPPRVRLPKVGHWLAELEAEAREVQRPCGHAALGKPEALTAYFRMQSFLYEVAAAYLMGARQGADGKAALLAYAEQVRQEMNAHCDKPFDIELLARQSGASPQRFYRAFRRLTGFSPHKYLTVLRLTRSLRLLASGSGSVAEVAHAVGYADELYFSRLFKRAMGVSPRQYMQCIREGLGCEGAAAGDLAPFGIAAAGDLALSSIELAGGLALPAVAPDSDPSLSGTAQVGDLTPSGIPSAKAARGKAAHGEVAHGEVAHGEVARRAARPGAEPQGLNWRQRMYRLGEQLGLEGVACFWISLLDRKLENAAHLLRRRWGQAEFLLIRAGAEGYQLCGEEDRGVGELIYRGAGFTAPEAVQGLVQRPIASLEDAASLGCPRALFLVPSGADRSRLEAAWCHFFQGQADARCLFLTWDGEDAPLAYERLVDQLTQLLLQPQL